MGRVIVGRVIVGRVIVGRVNGYPSLSLLNNTGELGQTSIQRIQISTSSTFCPVAFTVHNHDQMSIIYHATF